LVVIQTNLLAGVFVEYGLLDDLGQLTPFPGWYLDVSGVIRSREKVAADAGLTHGCDDGGRRLASLLTRYWLNWLARRREVPRAKSPRKRPLQGEGGVAGEGMKSGGEVK
jgi:hypothetical protein